MSDNASVRAKLARYAHLLAGVVIVFKGVGKIEHHQNGTGVILLAIGVVFMLFAFFHEKIPFIKRHEAVLLWIEAAVLAIIAFSYFSEGKTALPLAYAVLTVAYIAVGFFRYRKPKHAH